MNWRPITEVDGLQDAIEKLMAGSERWSEQVRYQDQGRVVLRDGDCKLIVDWIERMMSERDQGFALAEEFENAITPPAKPAVRRYKPVFDPVVAEMRARKGTPPDLELRCPNCDSVVDTDPEGIDDCKRCRSPEAAILYEKRPPQSVNVEPRSWRDAIGCAPAILGSISIEEAVRRVRDDEHISRINVESVLAEALESCVSALIELRDSEYLFGVAAVTKALLQQKIDKARAALELRRKVGE